MTDTAKIKALDQITELASGQRAATQDLRERVALARARGATWDEIGKALGVSRQAAQQRYGTEGTS